MGSTHNSFPKLNGILDIRKILITFQMPWSFGKFQTLKRNIKLAWLMYSKTEDSHIRRKRPNEATMRGIKPMLRKTMLVMVRPRLPGSFCIRTMTRIPPTTRTCCY